MKNLLQITLFLLFISCNERVKEAKNSFEILNTEIAESTKIAEDKVKAHFIEINAKQIAKYDGENSARIFYAITKHNRTINALIGTLKATKQDELKKKEIIQALKESNLDLHAKLNAVEEFNTKHKIDSLLGIPNDLETLSHFNLEIAFRQIKHNATLGAEMLLSKLNFKTKDHRIIEEY